MKQVYLDQNVSVQDVICLDVKDLRAGEYRRLKPYEIKQLNRLAMEGENK